MSSRESYKRCFAVSIGDMSTAFLFAKEYGPDDMPIDMLVIKHISMYLSEYSSF